MARIKAFKVFYLAKQVCTVIATVLVLVSVLVTVAPLNAMAAKSVRGDVRIDGSSTVFPITEAVAEEFGKKFPRVRVRIGVSGTGGGFKKFANNEIDINNASREIKNSEKQLAKKAKVDYLELPVAYDGISVVINNSNTWASTMTTAQLKKIWQANSQVTKWSDIDQKWPKTPIRLYGPGTDSGTFDYFTKAINGKSHSSRSNYTMSEDDNVLVRGVSGDKNALGYFGFAYYKENAKKIKAVAIRYTGTGATDTNTKEAVLPSAKTINNGTYKPLSRPVYIYVTKESVKNPAVKEFIKYYLENAHSLVGQVGYVALPKKSYEDSLNNFKKWTK